jgi:hypothetical protein
VDQPDRVLRPHPRAFLDLPAAGLGVAQGQVGVGGLHHVEQRPADGLSDLELLLLEAVGAGDATTGGPRLDHPQAGARTLALPHAPGAIRLTLPDLPDTGTTGAVLADLSLGDLRDIGAAVQPARLLDANCDPVAVVAITAALSRGSTASARAADDAICEDEGEKTPAV